MIRNSTNQISIKPRVSTKVKVIAAIVATLIFLSLVYLSYGFGVRSGHNQYEQDSALITQLNSTINGLQNDLDKSQQQIIFSDRQKQIQEEAYKQMSAAYASSEQKNRYLGSRLDFYRSIISPEGGQSGPAIQAIEYRKEDGLTGSDIAFDVTLVQAIKHKVNVTGNLVIELYDGDTKVSQWPKNEPRSVNYQYFQQISGVFESVEKSENASIKVVLSLRDGASLEKSFVVDVNKLIIEADEAK